MPPKGAFVNIKVVYSNTGSPVSQVHSRKRAGMGEDPFPLSGSESRGTAIFRYWIQRYEGRATSPEVFRVWYMRQDIYRIIQDNTAYWIGAI